jgi:two-component sensor histidine kinase
MVWWSLIFILCLTLGLTAVIHWPVRAALERRELDELRAQGAFIQSEVSGFLTQAEQLARQLPSRTRIREELVSYMQGQRSLQSYIEFARPKLADAVSASMRMVSAYRFDRDKNPIVGVNVEQRGLPPLAFDPEAVVMLPGSGRGEGPNVVYFVVPIAEQGYGLAGYDVVGISLEALAERVTEAAERSGGAHVAIAWRGEDGVAMPLHSAGTPEQIRSAMRDLAGDGTATVYDGKTVHDVRSQGGDLLLLLYDLRQGWVLGVSRERTALLEGVKADTYLFMASVGLLGLLAAGVAVAVLRTLSRRVVSDTDELDRIIDTQTRDLELLLKEIHHRVKNDISMMTSFLALKASQTAAPEAEQALAEAQRSLHVMGRVYERLQHAGHYTEASLQPLLSGVVSDVAGGNGTHPEVTHAIEAVTVPRKIAIPLGIIVNELVTNALKYGRGQEPVSVKLRAIDDTALELRVASGGATFPEEVLRGEYGFGLTMVDTLARQYYGELCLVNERHATAVVRIQTDDQREHATNL